MIKYQLRVDNQTIEVSLDASTPDDRAEIQYTGDADAVAIVEGALSSQYGIAGHLIGDITSPADLMIAMQSDEMQQFTPNAIEGSEMLQDYQLSILPDTVS
jgi:hypothetical protein